eukprot:CAMPEP_0175145014 /NCGR_PEP_ID=MMETSP0087-20121206/14502_1 /TAXON_ID=136419 /ORGANISM="Unknown Unknown, Strain D1" /LENGTH=206 /DNA_ID=CAMNT_0016429647 /DNA_START=54 /DNA_END=671 /DNA_ORIENTATION=+
MAELSLWGVFVALLYPHLNTVDEKQVVAALMPVVPGQYMHSLGTLFFRLSTCVIPYYSAQTPPLQCFYSPDLPPLASSSFSSPSPSPSPAPSPSPSPSATAAAAAAASTEAGGHLLVFASAAKSGAVLMAKFASVLGDNCGVCVASGTRQRPGIPGEEEAMPTYDGGAVLAVVNMRSWPEYAAQRNFTLQPPFSFAQQQQQQQQQQ